MAALYRISISMGHSLYAAEVKAASRKEAREKVWEAIGDKKKSTPLKTHLVIKDYGFNCPEIGEKHPLYKIMERSA